MSYCGSKLSMREIREILRLKHADTRLSHRVIGQSVRISPSTVGDVYLRFVASGLDWPLPDDLTDLMLEQRLYASKRYGVATKKAAPDWSWVHKELAGPDMTLALLWSEYKEKNGDQGYEYSRFCERYSEWRGRLNLSMRQVHTYGHKCFVDFAGRTVPIVDERTGEVILDAQIFVGVLGGSSYTFAEAVASQTLPCWIHAHVKMAEFFGGMSQIIVPDNLKSAVKSPDFYDPEINPTYHEWATHYNVAVVPARIKKPKDKAKAEVAVQLVQRWILAALRNQAFYNLAELNEAIAVLLDRLNARAFKRLPGSRKELFERERAFLQPLPSRPYELGIWTTGVKVPFDYHIKAGERLYSVPSRLSDQRVDIRLSVNAVEIYHHGERVFSHKRAHGEGPPITLAEHMPSHHRAYSEWNPERIIAWASEIGSSVADFCRELMARRSHPEVGFRPCLGVIKLADKYGKSSVESACGKAIRIRSFSYSCVNSILKNGLQNQPEPATVSLPERPHENLRGPAYYLNLGMN